MRIPQISYYQSTGAGEVRRAIRIGAWANDRVDGAGSDSSGMRSSLSLYFSTPRISYYNAAGLELRYAWLEAAQWMTERVDWGGSFNSLALGQDGTPHVAYYDTDSLKYAIGPHPWSIETVDTDGDVGAYVSLALDAGEDPHIGYYDATNGALKYATKESAGSWVIETVDSVGDVGSHASLALDPFNVPYISYYDATNGDLRLAGRRLDGIWFSESIDTAGDVGAYAALAIDPGFRWHISYYDSTNGDLKYASGECVVAGPVITDHHSGFRLDAVCPNPFKGGTTIAFDVPRASRIRISVLDVAGRWVRTLVDRNMSPGRHVSPWNGTDHSGDAFAPGVYFVRLEVGSHRATGKVVRVR